MFASNYIKLFPKSAIAASAFLSSAAYASFIEYNANNNSNNVLPMNYDAQMIKDYWVARPVSVVCRMVCVL